MRTILAIIITLLLSAQLFADDEVVLLSPFVVASAVDKGYPPITVKKTGDYLLLDIQLTNDTRDPEKRRGEVYDTIKSILQASADIPKMEISTAELILNARNFQVRLQDAQAKADTSTVELYLKLPLTAGDDVGALTNRLREFAQRIRIVGRTEVFAGEIGISVKNPERFRYEVISKVAEDVKKMKELFGDSFEIVVRGLDQRLKWQRTSISELDFYIPYSYEVFPVKGGKMLMNEKG